MRFSFLCLDFIENEHEINPSFTVIYMTPSSRYMRDIGNERLRLRIPNSNVILVVKLEHIPSDVQITASLQKLQQLYPLLNATVGFDAQNHTFFQEDTLRIPLLNRERTSETSWKTTLQKELAYYFEVTTGPLMRITVLRDPETNHGEILFNLDHSICDGLSITYLIDNFFTFIQYPEKSVEPFPIPIPIPPKKPKGLTKIIFQIINRKWTKKNLTFQHSDYVKLNDVFWHQLGQPHIYTLSLTEDATLGFLQACKQERVTVNSALTTAFLEAEHTLFSSPQSKFILAIDLRKYVPEVGKNLCYFAGGQDFSLSYDPSLSFWDNARSIQPLIRKKLTKKHAFASQVVSSLAPSFLDSMIFTQFNLCHDDLAVNFATKLNSKLKTNMVITNLGAIDVQKTYGDIRITRIFGPIIFSHMANKGIGICTIGNRLSIILCLSAAKDHLSSMEPYLDHVQHRIMNCVG